MKVKKIIAFIIVLVFVLTGCTKYDNNKNKRQKLQGIIF